MKRTARFSATYPKSSSSTFVMEGTWTLQGHFSITLKKQRTVVFNNGKQELAYFCLVSMLSLSTNFLALVIVLLYTVSHHKQL
jgi:hypothetical protein